MDCNPPGSFVHGMLQARLLEWVAIALSDICTTLYKIDNKDLLYSIGGFSNGSAVKNLPATQKTQEMQVEFLDREDPLEESMATYSSIPAWRIPWSEDPGGLWSIGRRVKHD